MGFFDGVGDFFSNDAGSGLFDVVGGAIKTAGDFLFSVDEDTVTKTVGWGTNIIDGLDPGRLFGIGEEMNTDEYRTLAFSEINSGGLHDNDIGSSGSSAVTKMGPMAQELSNMADVFDEQNLTGSGVGEVSANNPMGKFQQQPELTNTAAAGTQADPQKVVAPPPEEGSAGFLGGLINKKDMKSMLWAGAAEIYKDKLRKDERDDLRKLALDKVKAEKTHQGAYYVDREGTSPLAERAQQ